MTRARRALLLVALAAAASATATLPTPAQTLEDEFDCSRWRVYKFHRDDTVDCGCSCGFFDRFCC